MKPNKAAEMFAVLALAAVAWYLYARSKGLTLTGQYANPMMSPQLVTGNAMSPVASSNSVSTAALNVFSAISKGIATIGAAITHAGGNGPTHVPNNAAGIDPFLSNGAATTVGGDPVSTTLPVPDPTLDDSFPFWQWNFDQQPVYINTDALAFTVSPGDSYIPPPPNA